MSPHLKLENLEKKSKRKCLPVAIPGPVPVAIPLKVTHEGAAVVVGVSTGESDTEIESEQNIHHEERSGRQ